MKNDETDLLYKSLLNKQGIIQEIKNFDDLVISLRLERKVKASALARINKIFAYAKTDQELMICGKMLSKFKQYDLTARELHILYLILQNTSPKQISEICFIAITSVKFHKTNIYKKIGVKSERELLKEYYEGLYG